MRKYFVPFVLALTITGCTKNDQGPAAPAASAKGAALVEVSGSKQVQRIGAALDQPVVLQVNDAQGTAVKGALVSVTGTSGTNFAPSTGLTDDTGQFTTLVNAPGE